MRLSYAEVSMTFRLKLLLVLLALAVIFSLASYMLSNTRLELSGASLEDGSLSVETELPNAKCQKVLKRQFPFVTFKCAEKIEGE